MSFFQRRAPRIANPLAIPPSAGGGGGDTITGASIASGSTLFAGAVALVIAGATIASGASLAAGSAALAATGATIASGSTLSAGTVAQTVNGATLAAGSQVFAGSAAVGVAGGTIASTASLSAGSVAQTVSGATIASAAVLYAGAVTAQGTIAGATIASTATLSSGAISQVIAGATIASGSALSAGSVAQRVTGAAIASAATLSAGAVAQTLAGATIASTVALQAGTVALAVSGASIASTATLYAGVTGYGLPNSAQSFIVSTAVLYPGSVSLPDAVIPGAIDLVAVLGGPIDLEARVTSTYRNVGTFPTASSSLRAVYYDGAFWAIGVGRKLYRSTDVGRTWAEVGTDVLPAQLANAAFGAHDGKMWIAGGQDIDGATIAVETTYWSTDGLTWPRGSDLPVKIADAAFVGDFDGKMWVIGGTRLDVPSGQALPSQKVFFSTGGAWAEAGTDALPFEITGAVGVKFDGKMYLLGGVVNSLTASDIFETTTGLSWSAAAGSLPYAYAPTLSAAVVGDRVILVGGLDQVGGAGFLTSVYESLDVTTWTPARITLPQAVALGAAVTDGETLLLVSGTNDVDPLDTVYEITEAPWPIELAARLDGAIDVVAETQ